MPAKGISTASPPGFGGELTAHIHNTILIGEARAAAQAWQITVPQRAILEATGPGAGIITGAEDLTGAKPPAQGHEHPRLGPSVLELAMPRRRSENEITKAAIDPGRQGV